MYESNHSVILTNDVEDIERPERCELAELFKVTRDLTLAAEDAAEAPRAVARPAA